MPLAPYSPARTPVQRQRKPRLVPALWDALLHPVIRLPADFPWDAKGLAKLYFFSGLCYLIGSIVPLVLLFALGLAAIKLFPEFFVEFILDKNADPTTQFMLIAVIASFLGGFGAQFFYFRRQMRKTGRSLKEVLHLDLRSLGGSWTQAWQRSFIALIVGLTGQTIVTTLPHVPAPHQATADMAAGLHGGSLLVFAGLAALLAPFFEEIVFRGFVFNSLRKILRGGFIGRLVGFSERRADYLAVALSAGIFAAAHMDASSFLPLFVLGIVLAELYRRSGTLVCPMLLHAMNNVVATLLILVR